MNKISLFFVAMFLFFTNCSKNKKINNEEKTIVEEYNYVLKPSEIIQNKNLSGLIEKLENRKLITKNDKAEIPETILNFLNVLVDDFKISNPNENWNATDVIIDKNLPRRKLIYFGEGKNIALLSYHAGGIGKSTKIQIFEFDDEKIIDFWCGTVLVDLANKEEIIKYLKDNKNKKSALNTNILSY